MIYVIGDIHGCFYTLEKLVEKIFKKEETPQLVFVGDYLDRGLHSKKVVSRVIELQSKGAVCLRGNHDDIVDFLVNGHCVSDLRELCPSGIEVNQLNVGSWWLVNGLYSTLQDYIGSGSSGESFDLVLKMFAKSVPEDHRKFLRNLKMHWENDTHFACHAFFDPQKPLPRILNFLPESANHDMLWSRFSAKYSGFTPVGVSCNRPVWDKIGIFGHSPMSYYGGVAPIKHGNLRLIDTGTYQDEYLCAFCVEQDSWLLQATDSRDITSS